MNGALSSMNSQQNGSLSTPTVRSSSASTFASTAQSPVKSELEESPKPEAATGGWGSFMPATGTPTIRSSNFCRVLRQ